MTMGYVRAKMASRALGLREVSSKAPMPRVVRAAERDSSVNVEHPSKA